MPRKTIVLAAFILMLACQLKAGTPTPTPFLGLPDIKLLSDINQVGNASVVPYAGELSVTKYSGKYYYAAQGPFYGNEPCVYSSATGVTIVADINPGTADSDPREFIVMNGFLFFTAFDGTIRKLYKWDGATLNSYGSGSTVWNMQYLTVFNGQLYFNAQYLTAGRELVTFRTTDNMFALVKDFDTTGGVSGDPTELTATANALFMCAHNDANGWELWVCTNPALGATMLDIYPGSGSAFPGQFVVKGTDVFFSASDATHGRELWKADGNGAYLVEDINPGTASSNPQNLKVISSTIYFKADNGTQGPEIFKSVGLTYTASTICLDVVPGGDSDGINPGGFALCGTSIYFSGSLTSTGRELFRTDGTVAGTTVCNDIVPGPASSNPGTIFKTSGGDIFYVATLANGDRQVWTTNGSGSNTALDTYKTVGPITPADDSYFVAKDQAYSAGAYAASTGLELVRYYSGGSEQVPEVWTGNGSSNSFCRAGLNGRLYFDADDGVHGRQIWRSGLTETAELMTPSWPDSTMNTGAAIADMAAGTNRVYFFVDYPAAYGLYAIQDTPSSLTKLAEFQGIRSLVTQGDAAYFMGFDAGSATWQIFKSDGTGAGTVKLTSGSGKMDPMTLVNGRLFCMNYVNGTDKYQMFIYDIAAGTGQTIILRPGTTCSYFHVSWFMGKYYFASNDGVHGYEPWVSDGTPAGTALFKDIDPAGSNSGYGWFYTPVGGHLYFTAIDPAVGRARLYRTDGSAASTVLVEDDVTQGECLLIKAAGSTLLSIHRDLGTTPYHYYLCATQENLTYTAMIKDLGAGDSDDPEMMSANGLVFFNTVDGINGQQLWVSDGTAAGTGVVQVKTGYPYAQYGFHPARLIQVGNQLFATAYFQSENKEIMKLSLPAVPVPPAQGLDYSVTKENKALFGPNPVKHGDPLCLYFDAAPAKSKWEAYNLAGDRVATLEFESGTDNCWKTEKVAPGIYVLKGEVEYQDGTKKTVKQLVVVKP